MNTDPRNDETLDDALRFQLRALRQDVAPATEAPPAALSSA